VQEGNRIFNEFGRNRSRSSLTTETTKSFVRAIVHGHNLMGSFWMLAEVVLTLFHLHPIGFLHLFSNKNWQFSKEKQGDNTSLLIAIRRVVITGLFDS
jgi:hypothetical protein